jgi:hypothetical protein
MNGLDDYLNTIDRADKAVDSLDLRHCPECNSQRTGDSCWKCGTETAIPAKGWEYPAMPPIDRIRALAKEIGYAIAVHGSLERDLDLIAAPWSEMALTRNYSEVMHHIASGLGGKVIEIQVKPLGRRACTIQMNGYYKPIDLSVMPFIVQNGFTLNGYAPADPQEAL